MTNLAVRFLNTGRIAVRARIERRIPYWPRGRIDRLQRYRLRSIVRHAFRSVPFYQAAMEERGLTPADFRSPADLTRLPLIDGAFVRRDVHRFLSSRYREESRVEMSSSGSARLGVRTLVYWDHASQLRKLAIAERDRVVLTGILGSDWGMRQLHVLPLAGTTVKLRAWWDARVLTPRRVVTRHMVSADTPYDEIIDRIAAIAPDVVYSHGSFADRFFRHLALRSIRLSAPRLWAYAGDSLPPEGRRLIEDRFGIRVTSTYQAVESGRLGFECEARSGFHLNEDLCAVRCVDGEGEDVPVGEVGEVVISNLYNRAMVLLNYRLGDRARFATEPCPCGRTLPRLERLEGRVSEVIRLADGGEISSIVLRNRLRGELGFALQSQMVHPRAGCVAWRVVPLPGFDSPSAAESLAEATRSILGEGSSATVEIVDRIPLTRAGKHTDVVEADK